MKYTHYNLPFIQTAIQNKKLPNITKILPVSANIKFINNKTYAHEYF